MKPTKEELEKIKISAILSGDIEKYVYLRKDEKGFYIEYAFREGTPHDNRCLSWYDSYQEKAYIRNGWVKDVHDKKDVEYLALIKRKREDRVGQLFKLSSFTCGFEEDSDGRLKESEETWKEYHNEDEPFIPENYICRVGCPAPKCRECQCVHWTYEEPVKCACWNLREPVVPSRVMIPIDLAIKLYKQNLI
jgi:hypothetical protein